MDIQKQFFGREELMYRIGKEAEESVAEKLSKIFGYRNISIGVDGYSVGVEGYPDVQLIANNNLFYIEVKSMQPFIKRYGKNIINRVNGVKLSKDSWNRLKDRAKAKIATIIMIVEVRLLGENDYFIIDFDTVEDLFLAKPNVQLLEIPLHFIMMKCKKLEFTENEFIYNPINTAQIKINV